MNKLEATQQAVKKLGEIKGWALPAERMTILLDQGNLDCFVIYWQGLADAFYRLKDENAATDELREAIVDIIITYNQ